VAFSGHPLGCGVGEGNTGLLGKTSNLTTLRQEIAANDV
jgi:hypothetical protein